VLSGRKAERKTLMCTDFDAYFGVLPGRNSEKRLIRVCVLPGRNHSKAKMASAVSPGMKASNNGAFSLFNSPARKSSEPSVFPGITLRAFP
jgi:hypothetical protein